MSGSKRIVLVHLAWPPSGDALAASLRAAGAEVRDVNVADSETLLDVLEQGWMPIVLKPSAVGGGASI